MNSSMNKSKAKLMQSYNEKRIADKSEINSLKKRMDIIDDKNLLHKYKMLGKQLKMKSTGKITKNKLLGDSMFDYDSYAKKDMNYLANTSLIDISTISNDKSVENKHRNNSLSKPISPRRNKSIFNSYFSNDNKNRMKKNKLSNISVDKSKSYKKQVS